MRECRHFWRSRPGTWLLAATAADIALDAVLALRGIFMAPVAPALLAALAVAVLALLVALDFLKVRIFRRLTAG